MIRYRNRHQLEHEAELNRHQPELETRDTGYLERDLVPLRLQMNRHRVPHPWVVLGVRDTEHPEENLRPLRVEAERVPQKVHPRL